jgi:putative FmdB family regulatory protein
MPLYEYQCDKCAHRFEVIQKYSDPPIGECPKCGGAVKKLFSSPAIQFKGSGFYITDYAKQGSRDSKDSKDQAPTTSSSSSDTKTETKTDSKSETKSEPKSESKSDSKPSTSES